MKRFKKLLPLIILIALLIIAYLFNLQRYFSFSYLQEQHVALANWTQSHFLLASLIFCIFYIISVAISIPGASFLTIIGGFLFGIVLGSIYVVISATIGAVIIFLAAKSALSSWFEQKASSYKLEKFAHGFEENAFNYLLILRLVPLFPFWLVNIVPALFKIRTSIYTLSTFLGIIPGSVVYVLVGNGISAVIANNQTPNFGIIFEPYILAPLIGLAILSLIPVVYKKIKAHRSKINANKKS
ncbi:TVP38/TMEM64 family protein [Thiotrichales bacterium 19S3-7]|nr:TVP38/TMEM64 family protein [Thiotrichales bacterium 19S3-7]MCF6802955.1 TVP38/TMEM64 family protein [Thiotrichales bacterium 19S3-11]